MARQREAGEVVRDEGDGARRDRRAAGPGSGDLRWRTVRSGCSPSSSAAGSHRARWSSSPGALAGRRGGRGGLPRPRRRRGGQRARPPWGRDRLRLDRRRLRRAADGRSRGRHPGPRDRSTEAGDDPLPRHPRRPRRRRAAGREAGPPGDRQRPGHRGRRGHHRHLHHLWRHPGGADPVRRAEAGARPLPAQGLRGVGPTRPLPSRARWRCRR